MTPSASKLEAKIQIDDIDVTVVSILLKKIRVPSFIFIFNFYQNNKYKYYYIRLPNFIIFIFLVLPLPHITNQPHFLVQAVSAPSKASGNNGVPLFSGFVPPNEKSQFEFRRTVFPFFVSMRFRFSFLTDEFSLLFMDLSC